MARAWLKRWVVLGAVSLATSGGAAWAQDAEEEEEDAGAGFIITGRVQKPEVVVVIGRENLNKGFTIQLTESFLRRIQDVLASPPF